VVSNFSNYIIVIIEEVVDKYISILKNVNIKNAVLGKLNNARPVSLLNLAYPATDWR
jgi:hypothetical protein